MSDPQQPFVPPTPPVPPTSATGAPAPVPPAPGYAAPGYAAPPGALGGPAGGYGTPFSPAPAEPRGSGLGITALILALVAAVLCTIIGSWAAYEIGRGIDLDRAIAQYGGTPGMEIFTPVREVVLWAELSFWAGTLIGITALVLGIVAVVKRRGRGAGIAAIIIAAVGPVIFGIAVFFIFSIGTVEAVGGIAT